VRGRGLLVGVALALVLAIGGYVVHRANAARLVTWRSDPKAEQQDRAALGVALHRAPPRLNSAGGPDIVVIVLDTLRADRLAAYGATRDTTPRIDAWARGARVYTRTTSVGAWTLPAHASLFTGRFPYSHGARGVPKEDRRLASPLDGSATTVAEQLRDAGYRTIGIAGNRAFLDKAWGLSQGFDVYLCSELPDDARRVPYVPADRITAMAEQALSAPSRGARFLFLNYMDAHAPWIPRVGYVRDPDRIDRSVLPYGRGWDAASEALFTTGSVSKRTAAAWEEAYDADVRYLDEQVGRLLERLPELGVGEEDYVFVLADHGEYLGEHGLVEHSKDVYEAVLRVPLLVRGPGYAAGLDDTPRQTTDVARAVLTAAGLAPMGETLPDGLGLNELYWSRQRELRNPLIGTRFQRIRRSYRRGDQKVIVGSDGSFEAYDLAADPAESRSMHDAPWAAALRAEGEAALDALPAASGEAAFDGPQNTEALRQLGYVE
jgi:arylsulfatase A-like enzyme